MKKLSLLLAVLSATSGYAYTGGSGSSSGGGENDPLVKITGSLNPEFKTALTAKEFQNIKNGLNGLGQLKPISININDLMFEEDKPAIKAASQLISDVFVEATKKIVVLQVLAYRYAAIVQSSGMNKYLETVKQSYQRESQELYQQIVETFVDNYTDRFQEAIKLCKSDVCVGRIAYAQEELRDFGWGINQGLCVGCSQKIDLPKIESDIVKYAVAESIAQMSELAKTDGEVLVVQNFAAISSQNEQSPDLSLIVNSGVPQAQVGNTFYVLEGKKYKKHDMKKLIKTQATFANGMIAHKVDEIAKPSFGQNGQKNGSSSEAWIARKRDLLDVNKYAGKNYWEHLLKEALGGIGRCIVINAWRAKEIGATSAGFFLYQDFVPNAGDPLAASSYSEVINSTYLVNKSSNSDYSSYHWGDCAELIGKEIYYWLKAGKCDPK